MQFDEGKYFAYSPLFLGTQFALSYDLVFAAVSAVFVHVLLYHGADIKRQFKEARSQEDDLKLGLEQNPFPDILANPMNLFQHVFTLKDLCVVLMNWALGAIPGVCSEDQLNGYICPGATVIYTASVMWGAVGPLQWFWLIGRHGARRHPVPGTPLLEVRVPHRYRGWWLQYNYIKSAALDSGLIVSTFVIFLALYLSSATPPQQWFGNVGVFGTLDQKGEAVKSLVEEGQTFGPASRP
ncbi:hypothetical protein DL770_004963 [Monosporascus sp. CRB-9-2]|nr:hypothetical protein DL770_004963 [Monosporascus sp. CRB-9-2]